MNKERTKEITDDLVIKLLSEKDFESFWPLRLQALRDEPTSFGADFEEAQLSDRADVSQRLVSNDEQFVLGAFDPDLVGCVGFYRQKGKKSRHQGVIWGVYVKPDFRGKGIARQLMLSAIMCAQEIPDLEFMKLTVATHNKSAFNLYKSLGFKQYGVEFGALKVDGKYVDEALMQLKLHDES